MQSQQRLLLRRLLLLLSRPGFPVLAAVCLLFFFAASWNDDSAPEFPRFQEEGTPAFVERAVDGDTLLLSDKTRVRLLGVDTPETKRPDLPVDPLGLEAAEFTQRAVGQKTVLLRFDRERRDDYQRVLAYVYLDDWCLNEELIRRGYSRAITRFPYSAAMKRRFLDAEKEAQAQKVGLWKESPR